MDGFTFILSIFWSMLSVRGTLTKSIMALTSCCLFDCSSLLKVISLGSTLPNSWMISDQAPSTVSDPMVSAPMGSAPMGSAPMGFAPMGFAPMGSDPMGSDPMGSDILGIRVSTKTQAKSSQECGYARETTPANSCNPFLYPGHLPAMWNKDLYTCQREIFMVQHACMCIL